MADPVRYDERMSPSDALLWNNELDPMLRSTILSVMLLDGAPDPARFGARARALDRTHPAAASARRRSTRSASRPRAGRVDPLFDLDYHVRRVSVAGDGDAARSARLLAQPIAMQAFDKDRPLWELYRRGGPRGRQGGRS